MFVLYLYKFWGKIVGEKFAKRSKPYSMMSGGVMVVACENAIVAQELTLRKNIFTTIIDIIHSTRRTYYVHIGI